SLRSTSCRGYGSAVMCRTSLAPTTRGRPDRNMQLALASAATRRFVLSVGVLSLVLSGCVASEEPSGRLTPSVRAQYEELLEEARNLQSSDAQIAALEQSLASGKSITFEQYVQAKDAEIACVGDLGFDIVEEQRLDHGSWIEIKYLY